MLDVPPGSNALSDSVAEARVFLDSLSHLPDSGIREWFGGATLSW